MQVTLSTTTGGFAALSAQEVKRAGRHGRRGLELAQESPEGGKRPPELLALARQVSAQSVSHSIVVDTEYKQKMLSHQRNLRKSCSPSPFTRLPRKSRPSPHCLNRRYR
jgi:hypothetical protein